MNAHELARRLLAGPDLPIATHANGHDYMSALDGSLHIARLRTYGGDHVLIGNPYRADLNSPNWYITEWLDGDGSTPRPVGFVKHNGAGEIIFRQTPHESYWPDLAADHWKPVWT